MTTVKRKHYIERSRDLNANDDDDNDDDDQHHQPTLL